MKIIDQYAHMGADAIVRYRYPEIYEEIIGIINDVNPNFAKISNEVTMFNKPLFSPRKANDDFASLFESRGWEREKVISVNPLESIDYLKDRVGLELQFGKYPYVTFDFNRFRKAYESDLIEVGICVLLAKKVPTSTGVAKYETEVNRLKSDRPNAHAVPILILGIDNVSV